MWILWVFIAYSVDSGHGYKQDHYAKTAGPQVAEYSSKAKCLAAGKLIQDTVLFTRAVCTEK